MKKYIISIILMAFCIFAFCDDFSFLFNKNLTASELKTLQSGEVLIRKISSINKTVLKSNSKTESIIKEVKKRSPNYLAEIISVVPKAQCPDLLEQVERTILNIESYTDIPYYSEQHSTWFNLYDESKINSTKTEGNTTKLNYTVLMKPFGHITYNADLTKNLESLIFTTYNTSTAHWDRSSLVSIKSNKMFSGISVYEDSDYYVLYGVGALNAPSIVFLKDRLETAFLGRIKYFTKYIFEQIQ